MICSLFVRICLNRFRSIGHLYVMVMVERVMSGLTAVTHHPLSENTMKSPCPRYSFLSRVPRTITGNGERPMSGHRSSQDLGEGRVSGWTEISSIEGIDAQEIDQTLWRDYELPRELEMVQAGTPLEVCNIITASLGKHRCGETDSMNRDGSQNPATGNLLHRVRLEIGTEPSMADRSHKRSPRATSAASDTSLTSYATGSERSLARSSVSSASSAGLKPEPITPTVQPQRTPGLPKITMGPLGWIMTWEEGEKPKSWWRRRGLKKPKSAPAHEKVLPGERPTYG